jgi:hypothetical protein
VDGGGDELGGVVGYGIVHAGGEIAGLLGHDGPDLLDHIQGVGTGELEDLDGAGGLAV